MPLTYTLIASNTLTSSAASVTFSSIPSTYTDLVLRMSTRNNATGGVSDRGTFQRLTVNSLTSNYSLTALQVNANTASSNRASGESSIVAGGSPNSSTTANTFANIEMYFANYAGSTAKPISLFATPENNEASINWGFDRQWMISANLINTTSAISSVTITTQSGQFVSGSSFWLYGISSS